MTSLLRITKLSALEERTSLCASPIKISLSISVLRVGESNYIRLKKFYIGKFSTHFKFWLKLKLKKDFT